MLLQRIHTKYTLIRYSFTASSTKSISCRTNISSISTSSLEHINQIFFDCIFYQIYRTNISSVSHSNQTFFDCTFHETKSRLWNRPRKKFSQRIFLQIYLEHLGNQIFFYCILHPKPKSTVESIFHTKPRTNNRIILDCVKSTSQRIDFKIDRERERRKNSRATNAFHRVVVSILRSFPVEINREGGGIFFLSKYFTKRELDIHPGSSSPSSNRQRAWIRPFPRGGGPGWRRENNALEIQMTSGEERKGRRAIYQIKAALRHGRMPVPRSSLEATVHF